MSSLGLIGKIKRSFRRRESGADSSWTREDWIAFSAKQAGYRAARTAVAALPAERLISRSTVLSSKIPTQEDLSSNWARYWLGELGEPVRFHRQPWEFAYVLQSLRNARAIGQNVRALVLGQQRNALLSYLAARGVHHTVLVKPTDVVDSSVPMSAQIRAASHRHELVAGDRFDAAVVGRVGHLSDLAAELADFDVVWSLDHLNRLGNAEAARAEILAAVERLKPGGVGVFVFDLDLSSEGVDPASHRMRRGDLRLIAKEVISRGHYLAPLNLKAGSGPLDCFIDTPPYPGRISDDLKEVWSDGALHMKLLIGGAVCTSFGMTIIRGPSPN